MDDSLPSRIFTKLGVAILVVALLDLAFVNWVIIKEQKAQNTTTGELSREKPTDVSPQSQAESLNPSSSPQEQPKEVATSQTNLPAVVQKETQTIVQTAQKEIFVPMGSGSTTSSTYKDIDGTDVTIDTSKYSEIETVVFEASIWVVGGNGRAYARVVNVNESNPFIESVISNDTGTPTVKFSTKIPVPSGAKTYRIQAKTDITNFPAHVDNARLKITLK